MSFYQLPDSSRGCVSQVGEIEGPYQLTLCAHRLHLTYFRFWPLAEDQKTTNMTEYNGSSTLKSGR